ncbi:hypothetical protein KCP78_24845 [Salmonella enterica subsp. enterica]|nr:hypothetical protein KCP78_24845 [Salmonella enterica subsp. enterica]
MPVTTSETTLALADNLASLLEPALLIITGLVSVRWWWRCIYRFFIWNAMSGMG